MPAAPARWIDYYRASVADGARLCPNAKLLEETPGSARERLIDGHLPRKEVARLRQEAARAAGRTVAKNALDAGRAEAPLDVIVMPWVFAARNQHGERSRALLARFAPVVLRAWVDADGALRPHEEAPWVPRDRLRPVAHDHLTVGELAAADDFGSRQAFAPKRWNDVVEHAKELVQAVAERGVEQLADEDYVLTTKGVVCLAEGDTRMVRNILALCDALRTRLAEQAEIGRPTTLPTLLAHAGCEARERRAALAGAAVRLARSARHWATVSAKHPLAPTQRLALHELLDTPDGGVLAIQGPPGTGKTTLLKSVVAQIWVDAAVQGHACPIIVAASTNNQAVTNVIDAYAKDHSEPRWLPGVSDLCLYATSEESEGAKSGEYQLMTTGGAFSEIERRPESWLPAAQRHFLACAAKEGWSPPEEESVRAMRDALRERVRGETAKIAGLFATWQEMLEQLGDLTPENSLLLAMERRAGQLSGLLREAEEREADAEKRKTLVADCAQAWDERLANEPWWQVLFAWLAPVKARRDAGRRLVLQPFTGKLGEWANVEAAAVAARLKSLREEAERDGVKCAKARAEAARALRSWQAKVGDLRGRVENLWEEASEEQRAELPGSLDALWRADGIGIEALADATWRVRAFRAAIHFWEADYLLEMESVAARGHRRGESDTALWTRNLRRWARLAPCVASTFFSLPKYFRGQHTKEPLWGEIDLLVADESGQVPPEKATPSFALARRALVVGDVLQIEPVWNVPASVDTANAAKFGLIAWRQARAEWAAQAWRAVSASGGTLMELAQQASEIGHAGGEGGLLLREHRRCVPEIVAFNNVVYGGLLEPKRASVPTEQRILPALGYAALPFRAEQRGGGRCNVGEARLIAAWLQQRRTQIEEHYGEIPEHRGKKLDQLVAVVTPFRAQKRELAQALDERLGKGHGMTAGTVHALQGAEYPIVIFSPVYDETHRGSYFFNGARGSAGGADPRKRFQMLNVAVSRAQDTFLVFGCLDAFHPSRGDTPAGALGRYLFGEHGHEITDLPWEAGRQERAAVAALRDTAAHEQMLHTAIVEARRSLTISSPFLTKHGLTARGVLPSLAEAVRKGVNVEVFVDGGLTRNRTAFEDAVATLRSAGVEVRISRPDQGVHAKTLAMDDRLLVEGSFNWFAASAEGAPYHRYEASLVYRGDRVGAMIEEALSSLRQRAGGDLAGISAIL